ncbi:MAG: HAD family hydrolase [Candidatus Dormibacteria bacterium]
MSGTAPLGIGFDYGGTLVKIGYPGELLARAGDELLADLQVTLLEELPKGASFGVQVDRLVDQLVAEEHLRQPLREVEILGLYERALRQLLGRPLARNQVLDACLRLQEPWAEAITVDSEVLPVLGSIRERGLRLGLLSNAPYPPTTMRRMMDRQGISQRFDEIVLSSEIGWRKPAPEAFAALLGRLGIPAERAWFVGDEMEADIAGAEAAGMTALLAPGSPPPAGSPPALRSWGDLLSRLDRGADPGDS